MSISVKAAQSPELDLGRCIDEAIVVYRRNFLTLFLAGIVWETLTWATLMLLAGPLAGGLGLMCLRALDRPDRSVVFGDFLGGFRRFWGLTGLFLIGGLATLIGLGLFVVPGLALMTLWLYPTLFLVDRDLGVFGSLRASQDLVLRRGFWPHVGLLGVVLALTVAPLAAPVGGMFIGWLLAPVAWLTVAAAYRQGPTGKPAPWDDPALC